MVPSIFFPFQILCTRIKKKNLQYTVSILSQNCREGSLNPSVLQEEQNPCFPIYLCIFLSGGISSYSYIARISLLVFFWHSLLTISQSSRYQKCSPRLSRPACLHREGLFLSWCSYHNWGRVGNQTSSDNPVDFTDL